MSKNSPNKSSSGSPISEYGRFQQTKQSSDQRVRQAPSNPGTPSRGVYDFDSTLLGHELGDTPPSGPYYSPTNQGSRTSASPPSQNAAQQGASRQGSPGRLAPPPQNTGWRGDSETRGRRSTQSPAARSSTGGNYLGLNIQSPVSFGDLTDRSRSRTGAPNTPSTTQPPGPPAFLTTQPTGSQSQGHAMPQSAYHTWRLTQPPVTRPVAQPTVHPDFHTMRATGSQYHSHTMPNSAALTQSSSEQAPTSSISFKLRSIASLQQDYDTAVKNNADMTTRKKLLRRIREARKEQGLPDEGNIRIYVPGSKSVAELEEELEQARANKADKKTMHKLRQRVYKQRAIENAQASVAEAAGSGVQGGTESGRRQHSQSPGIGSSRQAGGPPPAQNLRYPYAPASPPASGTASGLNDDLYSDDRPTRAVNMIPRVTRPGSRGGSRPPPTSRGASPAARSGSRPPRTEDNRGRMEASRSRSGSRPTSQSRGRAPPAVPQTVGASGSWTGMRRPTNSSPPATLSKAEIAARKKDDKAKADKKKADEKERAKDEKKRKAKKEAEEKKAKKQAQEKKSPKPQPKPKPGPSGGGKRK